MNVRLLSSPLLACLAIATAPVDARVSIPPSDPPFCDIPEEPSDFDTCTVISYSMRDCPDIEPLRPEIGSPDAENRQYRMCLPEIGPIQAHIECDSGDIHATCRANPTGLPDHAYLWTLEGAIQATDDDLTGTSLTLGCTQTYGEGKLRLAITNPATGITSETSVRVTCAPTLTGPAGTKD